MKERLIQTSLKVKKKNLSQERQHQENDIQATDWEKIFAKEISDKRL